MIRHMQEPSPAERFPKLSRALYRLVYPFTLAKVVGSRLMALCGRGFNSAMGWHDAPKYPEGES